MWAYPWQIWQTTEKQYPLKWVIILPRSSGACSSTYIALARRPSHLPPLFKSGRGYRYSGTGICYGMPCVDQGGFICTRRLQCLALPGTYGALFGISGTLWNEISTQDTIYLCNFTRCVGAQVACQFIEGRYRYCIVQMFHDMTAVICSQDVTLKLGFHSIKRRLHNVKWSRRFTVWHVLATLLVSFSTAKFSFSENICTAGHSNLRLNIGIRSG